MNDYADFRWCGRYDDYARARILAKYTLLIVRHLWRLFVDFILKYADCLLQALHRIIVIINYIEQECAVAIEELYLIGVYELEFLCNLLNLLVVLRNLMATLLQ